MNQAESKKHHYVPQFILKRFCVGKKKKLYVFDKKESNIFSSSTLDVGHENHFYRDDGLGYGENTEKKLSKLESECAPIISRIIDEESLINVSKYEHALICLFVVVQHTRTNKTREFLSGMNKKISDWVRSIGKDPNKDVEDFKEQSEDEIKGSSINILRTIPGDLAKHLLDKEWALVKSPKGEFFYISDHPVTMHNYYPRQGRGNLGFALKGIEIHFPISPRLSLTFMCSEMVGEVRDRVRDHNIRISNGNAFPVDMTEPEMLIKHIDSKKYRILNPDNVEFHNSLQVSQSSRFVYAKSKDFELAEDMLKSNPELSEPQEL